MLNMLVMKALYASLLYQWVDWTFSRVPCQITLCQIFCRNTFKFIMLVVLDGSTVPSALFITLSSATIVDGHVNWGKRAPTLQQGGTGYKKRRGIATNPIVQ